MTGQEQRHIARHITHTLNTLIDDTDFYRLINEDIIQLLFEMVDTLYQGYSGRLRPAKYVEAVPTRILMAALERLLTLACDFTITPHIIVRAFNIFSPEQIEEDTLIRLMIYLDNYEFHDVFDVEHLTDVRDCYELWFAYLEPTIVKAHNG